MNLLDDAWIPVRHRSGSTERVVPSDVVAHLKRDPVVALDTGRPDFDTALVQFLIGLLQTTCPPQRRDDRDWLRWLEAPPAPAELDGYFRPWHEAFRFDEGRCRFMQDRDLASGEARAIAALLIEQPTGKTLTDNADLFVHRGGVGCLGRAAAATALFTLQINAPSGGQGHRTSLRGGGPLTTLLCPDPAEAALERQTLWHLLWLNVLPAPTVHGQADAPDPGNPESVFPWMGATRTSEPRTGCNTTPEDVHPLQAYWSMPRRIRLDEAERKGNCDLWGDADELVSGYRTRNLGVNYTGAWQHPLSPYWFDGNGQPVALHPGPRGLGYRDWVPLTLGREDAKSRQTPARVVGHAMQSRARRQMRTRLWAFGYDMDNMKARGWHEAELPVLHLEPEDHAAARTLVEYLVDASSRVAWHLQTALAEAWQARSNATAFVAAAFWANTEAPFYRHLRAIEQRVASDPDLIDLRHSWFATIDDAAMALFAHWAESGDLAWEDPKAIAMAHNRLRRKTRGREIREALALDQEAPTPERTSA